MSGYKFAGPIPQPPVSKDLGPPFIHVDMLANLRDVATGIEWTSVGSQNGFASKLRPRTLYRAADPSGVDIDGLSTLHNTLRISTIFDLRSAPEIARAGGLTEWEQRIAAFNSAHGGSGHVALRRFWTPVFAAEDYSPEAVALRFKDYGSGENNAAGFVRAYSVILEYGSRSFGIILRHLAGTETDEGTLVHCTAGKDRTGVLVAVLLRLLDVPPEAIAAEYQLTEIGLRDRRPMSIARLVSTGVFGAPGPEAEAAAERMTGSRVRSMLSTLNFIDDTYGGAENYVRNQCGVAEETIAALRRRFLEGDKTSHSVL
jgi:protein tyrosine/serine phosphatase